LGTSVASTIARRLGENRVTVYSILKNLVKRGIASETPRQNSTYYTVILPEKLMQRLQDKYQALKDALPQFLAIANKYDTKPQVQFFDGIEGLKNLYEDHLTSQEDLLSFL